MTWCKGVSDVDKERERERGEKEREKQWPKRQIDEEEEDGGRNLAR